MKTALCLYGYFNNRSDNSAGNKGFQYITDKLFSFVDGVDVFIHSWDLENETKIKEYYKPINCIFDKQFDFSVMAKDAGIDEEWINEGFARNQTIYAQCTIQASLSFYYSRGTAIDLKTHHEKTNGFKYDCVIVARFDLGHRSAPHIGGYNVSLMPFSPTLDMNYIYSAMWKQLNAGYADQWFFSNSDNINLLGTMFEYSLSEYFQKNSEYFKAITGGWFDSSLTDDFSNEMLAVKKSPFLFKYPKWQMINNHILHKWHLKNVGLYEKSKFL